MTITQIPENGIKKLSWTFFFELKDILKKVIDESSYDPSVKRFADQLTVNTGFDFKSKINRISTYIDSHFSFNRDPETREYVTLPKKYIKMLEKGQIISGDCDDVVVLLCSLYKSIGLNTFMVFISPLEDPPYTHVMCAVLCPCGDVIIVDLVNKEKMISIGKTLAVKV